MCSPALDIATKWQLNLSSHKPTARHIKEHDLLVYNVLGVEVESASDFWRMFALFTEDGTCVATVDAGLCPITFASKHQKVGAIRSVAVRDDWRGRGLFRALLTEALAWTDDGNNRPTLLFTAEPDLYRTFGFIVQAQHAFVGPASVPEPGPPARMLDIATDTDISIVQTLYTDRTPLSRRCALEVDWPLFAANLRRDDAFDIAFCVDLDAVVVYEHGNDDEIVLVDVVARRMPTLAQILGRIASPALTVRTLFPPDRLAWDGRPEPEDTGLMIRGLLPTEMKGPFMLPPTVEF